jgi:hypothetical protein
LPLPVAIGWLNAFGTVNFGDLPLPAVISAQHDTTD